MDMDIAEFGRFADPALLIMASLADGPKHGYAIMEDVASLAGARLGPGTLYGALARLERRGLVAAVASTDRRRPYRLTGVGAALLRAQLSSMCAFATAGLKRLEAV